MEPPGPAHSKQLLSSLSAMVVSQLPFPPMPLCVVRDCKETFCSSHDLMAMAVAVHFHDMSLRPSVAGQGAAPGVMQDKERVLLALQGRIWHICEREGFAAAAVEQCYAAFQQAFREYMQFYPCSRDVRFMPLCSVDPKSTLTTQALAHLRSVGIMEQCSVPVDSDRYPDILRAYCRHMHSYGPASQDACAGPPGPLAPTCGLTPDGGVVREVPADARGTRQLQAA